jgi:hypothetical protein
MADEESAQTRAEIASLRLELAAFREEWERELDRILREIAYDRQRLARLEQPPDPTPSQKDRGEVLKALLVAHGGKMPIKEARRKMHLSKPLFSQLLSSLDGDIEAKPYHLDRRQKILRLK